MTPPRHYPGLDAARVLAIGLVTVQHVVSLRWNETHLLVGGISIGQYGVAVFLLLSGFLASQSRRPPFEWLAQRLGRLLPAYWIAMAGCFLLADATGHKSFDADQVFSQMAGLGFWTHREKLVNSPTWFVSVVLVCYLATFLARVVRVELLMVVLALCVFLTLALRAEKPRMDVVYFTYALGCLFALVPPVRLLGVIFASTIVLTAAGFATHREFLAAAFAAGLVGLAIELPRVPRIVSWLANYTYEYFLIHGVILYGAIRGLPSRPEIAVPAAIAASIAAAVVLKWATEKLLLLVGDASKKRASADAPAKRR